MKKAHKKRICRTLLLFVLSLSVAAGTLSLPPKQKVYAASEKLLKLSTCRNLALTLDSGYDSADDAVNSAESKMRSSIKSLNLKEKTLTTFQWSPLLSFKFPQKLTMAQKSEFTLKPLSLASDLRVAQHKKQDKVFEVNEKVNRLYVEIVTIQENIDFNQKRLDSLNDGIKRNRAKLQMGDAKQSDIDSMEKKATKLNDTIASDRRKLEADLKKLSKMVGLDVTTGYRFEKPYVEAAINRESLPALIQYTEDRDETYYEACVEATSARTELRTNYDLMKNYYGGDIGLISTYVGQALNDQDVPKSAFKKAYKAFLKKIDSYWEGKYVIKILFIKISFPKLWFKGSLDGTRWIEDDTNILESNVLDYVAAHKAELAARDDLDQQVEDAYNNYISVKNTYTSLVRDVDKQKQDLDAYLVKNRMGEMTFEEYNQAQDDYEELQNNMLSAMQLYTDTLHSFDRLTCGGVSALLSGTDADMKTAVVGESYVDKSKNQVIYYLKPIIQRELFELSIFVPDGFPTEITDFELWCDNRLIGEKTPKDKTLRHMMLTKESIGEAKIRLYNGDEVVDDCKIDPEEEQGVLDVTTSRDVKKNTGDEIGTYTTAVSEVTKLLSVTLKPDKSEGIAAFRILTKDGAPLGNGEKTKIDKSFTHLGLVASDLKDLEIEFYGADDALKYKGRFDTANQKLKKKETP